MSGTPEGAEDDKGIPDEGWLLRRIPRFLCEPDGSLEKSNFDERQDGLGLSVTYWQTDSDLQDILRNHEDFGIVAVPVAAIRAEGGVVVRSPLVGNLNHCEIYPRMKNNRARRLRDAARWVYYPPWVMAEHRIAVLTLA